MKRSEVEAMGDAAWSGENAPKNTEEFLRKWFGLEGPFYTTQWLRAVRRPNGPRGFRDEVHTKRAQYAWYKAIMLANDLEAMGLISEETKYDIVHGLCDLG